MGLHVLLLFLLLLWEMKRGLSGGWGVKVMVGCILFCHILGREEIGVR